MKLKKQNKKKKQLAATPLHQSQIFPFQTKEQKHLANLLKTKLDNLNIIKG